MATLINGNGNEAVYAQQDADLYTGAMGASTRILNVGSTLEATIEDANTIAVADGVILTKEGRRIQVDVGNIDEFTIPTGQAGTTRYYIIGYHLYTDGSANQKCETFVQLMADESETIPEASFREGATEVYVSLYRVKQDGLTLNTPAALLSVGNTMSDIEDEIAQVSSDLTDKADKPVLLWTNDSPTSAFAAQTIQKDLSDFTHISIDYKLGATSDTIRQETVKVGGNNILEFVMPGSSSVSYAILLYHRSVTVNIDSIVFSAGNGGRSGAGWSTDNNVIIPVAIYGVDM